jgi:hypothetical protein
VAIGTDSLGSAQRGNERDVVILQEKSGKVHMVIGWKQARAEIVQRHQGAPRGSVVREYSHTPYQPHVDGTLMAARVRRIASLHAKWPRTEQALS